MDASDRLLVRVARGGSWWAVGLAAVMLIDSAISLILPALLGQAVDAALGATGSRDALVLLAALILLTTVAEMGHTVLERRISAMSSADLRSRLVDRVLHLGVPGQRRFEAGDLLARVLQATPTAAQVGPTVVRMAASSMASLGAVVALGLIDWRLPLVLAAGVPIGLVIGRIFVRRFTDISTRYQEVHGGLAGRFVDAVGGARTIRASGTVDREVGRVLEPLGELHAAGREMWDAQRSVGWQVSVLSPFLQIAVLITAGLGIAEGRISPGQVLAAVGYLHLAMGLMRQIMMLGAVGMGRSGARRLHEVLEPEDDRPPGAAALPPGTGRLELRGVTVRAGEDRLLDGITLDVPAGTSVAVVGESGTGKSTIAAVAGRLIEPDAGQVLLDGVALEDLAPDQLRSAISYAFEVPELIGTTVADAVGYADPPLPRQRVETASRHARAHDFVQRLPEGYDTPVKGLALSGGERQRLGIARAAARRPRLVVLDDATSSLDTATELAVTRALERALEGVTRLVVAHRVSTAARADVVVWLEGGRVRAVAPHEELWRDHAYRRLFGWRRDAEDDPSKEVGAPSQSTR